ncbi:hypothetical protein [Nocardioides marinisabuli]|uniref:hypothetical protein n=1 Tax=Nocardioides marinisabuli TaxID=419476 RepID=UPI0015DDB450|nr:hypothetical protein [Nocardioides marinisabuli]
MPHFVRVSPGVGGDALTRALAEETGLDWPAAELRKRGGPEREGTSAAPDPVLDEATQRLLTEVRTTLDFHAATDPAHVPISAVLSGGAGHQHGFLERASGVLGLPVGRLDLGAHLGLPGDDGYDLALPAACAWGAAHEHRTHRGPSVRP